MYGPTGGEVSVYRYGFGPEEVSRYGVAESRCYAFGGSLAEFTSSSLEISARYT